MNMTLVGGRTFAGLIKVSPNALIDVLTRGGKHKEKRREEGKRGEATGM